MINNILSSYKYAPLMMAIMAASALGIALISQYWGGLEPCILCLYQRWPFGIVIALGLIGFLSSFKCTKGSVAIMGMIGVTFLVNTGLAIYHTGVEQKWWRSHFEGCAVPKMEGNMEDVLAAIQSRTKAARCDEVAWSDPVLGLSMANYNIMFCFGLAVLAFYSANLIRFRTP